VALYEHSVFTQGAIWDVSRSISGGRAGQGAGPAHHPRAREPGGAQARPRQLTNTLIDATGCAGTRGGPRWTTSTAQLQKMKARARLHRGRWDQSGGSTPNRLRRVRNQENAWANDEQMFALVHRMRTRIITAPRSPGADSRRDPVREHHGPEHRGAAHRRLSVGNVKRIVPLLKVDKGLVEEKRGVQLMKPMPELGALARAWQGQAHVSPRYGSIIKHRRSGHRGLGEPHNSNSLLSTSSPPASASVDGSGFCPEKARAKSSQAAILEKLDGWRRVRLVMPQAQPCRRRTTLYAGLSSRHPRS